MYKATINDVNDLSKVSLLLTLNITDQSGVLIGSFEYIFVYDTRLKVTGVHRSLTGREEQDSQFF